MIVEEKIFLVFNLGHLFSIQLNTSQLAKIRKYDMLWGYFNISVISNLGIVNIFHRIWASYLGSITIIYFIFVPYLTYKHNKQQHSKKHSLSIDIASYRRINTANILSKCTREYVIYKRVVWKWKNWLLNRYVLHSTAIATLLWVFLRIFGSNLMRNNLELNIYTK